MSHYKIGFHTGPGGNPTGIGDYYKRLDTARIPATVKSVDHYGMCWELANLAAKSGVPHVISFRLSTRGQDDGFDYDVPLYHLDAKQAAAIHLQATLAKLPPEFQKDLVWLEPINEIDRNRSDWLGEFGYQFAMLAMDVGYKVCLFGWSSGEPEFYHWKTPGMRKFLELCAAMPDKVAVSIHEYSFHVDYLLEEPPIYRVGRFQQLFEACDDMGIKRPTVLITEFGWTLWEIPSVNESMDMMLPVAKMYAQHDEILCANIWYLGAGFGSTIYNQTQRLIGPVTEVALAWDYTPPTPPPSGGKMDDKQRWVESITEQTDHGLQLAPTAIQDAIRKDGFHPVTKEMYIQGEPPMMAAEDWKYRTKKRRLYLWEGGVVRWINDPF